MLQTAPPVQTYSLQYNAKPWLMNEDKRLHPMTRHRLIEAWRDTFTTLARTQRVPHMDRVRITVVHHRPDRRSMPDHCAPMPAFKAALDGIVQAGVLDDDSPKYIEAVTFVAPQVTGRHGLELILEEVA